MTEGVVTLEMLRRMMQRVLDAQEAARTENRQMRRELARIDRVVTSLQHGDIDRVDSMADIEERLDALARRVASLEDGP